MAKEIVVSCKCCGKKPSEIPEYRMMAKEEGYATAEEFVREEEGTYNAQTGKFYCTDCYVKIGCPTGTA